MNELTTGIQQLSAQWYDHTDATRLAEVIRLSVAAQELEQRQAVQEPDWYHAECMDPDRSGFFVDKADAEARVSDQGGTVTALYTAAPQPAQVPLTEEQIEDMRGEANRGFNIEREDYTKAVRDTEQAHGIHPA